MPPHFQGGYIEQIDVFVVQLINNALQILFHTPLLWR